MPLRLAERLRTASAAALRSEAMVAAGTLASPQRHDLAQGRDAEVSTRAALRAAESARAEAERRRDAVRRSTSERADRITRLDAAVTAAQARLNEIALTPEQTSCHRRGNAVASSRRRTDRPPSGSRNCC